MPVDVSDNSVASTVKPMTAVISDKAAEMAAASGVDAVAVVAKVNFDMALKRAAGNHFSFDTLSFNGIELSRALSGAGLDVLESLPEPQGEASSAAECHVK